MKISKDRLKQIVREELKNLSEKEISLSGEMKLLNELKTLKIKIIKCFSAKKHYLLLQRKKT